MTLRVTVKFFTTLREITGKREEQVEFSRSGTIESLLKQLSKKYGREFDDYIFDELGSVHGHLQFLVNGKSATGLNDLKTRLKDGDQVAILPPVGGG